MGLYTGNLFIALNFLFHREKRKDKSVPYRLKKKVLQKQFSKKRNIKQADQNVKKSLVSAQYKSFVIFYELRSTSLKVIKQAKKAA